MAAIGDARATVVVGAIVLIALMFAPVRERALGRRAVLVLAFVVAGEVIVGASKSADWLRAGLLLLVAGMLLLAELAALGSAGGKGLVGLLWLGCAGLGFWQWSAIGEWVGAHRAWVMITAVEWVRGDMRTFDLGRTFDLVFIAANSLLHLQEVEDLVSCFRSVRRQLAHGARFVFDVFNPGVRLLAEADGVRRNRESLSFMDPDRGNVSVDVAEIYDAPA